MLYKKRNFKKFKTVGYISKKSMKTIVCLKWGDKYSPHYVNVLYNGLYISLCIHTDTMLYVYTCDVMYKCIYIHTQNIIFKK